MAGTLQTLISISGGLTGQSDPVAITSNPVISVKDPSITSGGINVVSGVNQDILAGAAETAYVFVRNTGASGGGGGTGILDLTSVAGVTVANLKVGDFCYIPVFKGHGMRVKYKTANTQCVFAVFTQV